jgi:predicted nucleic acid-binding protein
MIRRRACLAADPPHPLARSSDPDDDYLLALAEAERALVVTGDRHLLTLAPGLPVVSPREFVDRLDAEAT